MYYIDKFCKKNTFVLAVGFTLVLIFSGPVHSADDSAGHSSKLHDSEKPYVVDGTMDFHDWKLLDSGSDEFNEPILNSKKWDTEIRSWGRNWNWSPDNVFLRDGKLNIEIKYAPTMRNRKSISYTSGIVQSRQSMLYGYFEARIKGSLPQPGTNPAFWLGDTVIEGRIQWTEIDILEAGERNKKPGTYRVDHIVHVFRHHDAPDLHARPGHEWSYNIGGGASSWDPSADYHVYGLAWTPQKIKVYVDGVLQGSIANRWWHQELNIIFTLGLRAPYQRNPSPEGFPGIMRVDYVRTWTSASANASTPLRPKTGQVHSRKVWKRNLDAEHHR